MNSRLTGDQEDRLVIDSADLSHQSLIRWLTRTVVLTRSVYPGESGAGPALSGISFPRPSTRSPRRPRTAATDPS